MYSILALIIVSLSLLYLIATSELGAIYKFVLAIVELGVAGVILRKIVKPTKDFELDGEWGLILLKTKKGLKFIDQISKNQELWKFFADVGLVAGYGIFSLVIMRKHLDWKKFICGIILLTFLIMFVVPYAIPFLIVNLKGQVLSDSATSKYVADDLSVWISGIITYGFGMFGVVFAGIVQAGSVVISKLIGVLLGTGEIDPGDAGVTLIIPGINIPLVEGIIALFVILVVHEGAHAILGRIARVPLLSSGIVLFGVIPIGAFVEPDEEWLQKMEKTRQTRVMIAGPAGNFLVACLTVILFMGFVNFTQDYMEQGLLIFEGMEYGTVVYAVNGIDVNELRDMNFSEGDIAVFVTNKGIIEKTANEEGKLGINGYYLGGTFIVKYKEDWMNFVYATLGLIFSLNFVIGVVNLLPIPAFDGHRIIELNIGDKNIVKLLTYASIVGLIMNFIPWLF